MRTFIILFASILSSLSISSCSSDGDNINRSIKPASAKAEESSSSQLVGFRHSTENESVVVNTPQAKNLSLNYITLAWCKEKVYAGQSVSNEEKARCDSFHSPEK